MIIPRSSFTVPLLLLLLLCGCDNSLLDRSLVFATHTTAGIEVSVNPTEAATSPIALVIGYRRFEGVLNPVYYNHRAEKNSGTGTPPTNVNDYYRTNAYSVLATFEGEGKAKGAVGPNGEVQGGGAIMQVFATGEAARIAAQNPAALAALSGAAVAPDLGLSARGEGLSWSALYQFYNVLSHGNAAALQLRETLDRAASEIDRREDVTLYRVDAMDGDEVLIKKAVLSDSLGSLKGFERLHLHVKEFELSAAAIEKALENSLQYRDESGQTVDLCIEVFDELMKNQRSEFARLRDEFHRNKVVRDAVADYYLHAILGGEDDG